VLTERRQIADAEALRETAGANFERYARALHARVTVPSSFGWRVQADSDSDYSWCNATLFPFHPAQAVARLDQLGMSGLVWGPGQVMTVAGGTATLSDGPWLAKPHDFGQIYGAVSFDPAMTVPPFDPATDRIGLQRDPSGVLAERLVQELIGTDYWYRSLETGASHLLRVFADDGTQRSYVIDPGRGWALPGPRHDTDATHSFTDIAGATLQSLLDAELLIGSSYGLWSSNGHLLSAVFHQPQYYVRHVERALALPATGERR
jgi:hypothetical protein